MPRHRWPVFLFSHDELCLWQTTAMTFSDDHRYTSRFPAYTWQTIRRSFCTVWPKEHIYDRSSENNEQLKSRKADWSISAFSGFEKVELKVYNLPHFLLQLYINTNTLSKDLFDGNWFYWTKNINSVHRQQVQNAQIRVVNWSKQNIDHFVTINFLSKIF